MPVKVLFSLHPLPGLVTLPLWPGNKDEREKREDLTFNFLFPFISCFLHPQTMKKALKEMKDKEIKK